MIEVENACFSYDKKTELLHHLSFRVEKRQNLAVLGPNGVGKTTLLRCMMNFLRLDQGSIRLAGRDARKLSAGEFWKTLSYVPQARGHVFGYSVLTMVVMGRSPYVRWGRMPRPGDYRAAEELLHQFGIGELSGRSCNSLSSGQLQLVLIARALAKNPQILIMDEPESNLDMKNQLKVLEIVERLSREKGLTILINTHFPAHALRVADKTLLLGPRGYLFSDTRQVITRENLVEYFGVRAEVLSVEDGGRRFDGIVPTRIAGGSHV